MGVRRSKRTVIWRPKKLSAAVEIYRQIIGLYIEWDEGRRLWGCWVSTWVSILHQNGIQTFASVYKGCRYKMNNDLSRANKEAKVTLGWSAYSDETVLHES